MNNIPTESWTRSKNKMFCLTEQSKVNGLFKKAPDCDSYPFDHELIIGYVTLRLSWAGSSWAVHCPMFMQSITKCDSKGNDDTYIWEWRITDLKEPLEARKYAEEWLIKQMQTQQKIVGKFFDVINSKEHSERIIGGETISITGTST
mgnify:CR=1 FL=1|jgi:hypothetical protein